MTATCDVNVIGICLRRPTSSLDMMEAIEVMLTVSELPATGELSHEHIIGTASGSLSNGISTALANKAVDLETPLVSTYDGEDDTVTRRKFNTEW